MSMFKTPCVHEPLSPVIQRCCDARNRVFLDVANSFRPKLSADNPAMNPHKLADLLARAGESYETTKAASAAYRYAMPDPGTRQGIRDYIACVLHGMTVQAINKEDGASLLAGARIALASYRGRPVKSAEKANTSVHTQIPQQPAA